MISFFSENAGTIFVAMILVIVFVFAFMKIRKDKKNGNGCGCGCSGCPSQGVCHKAEDEKHKR